MVEAKTRNWKFWVLDDGPGIQNTANVFVPFFHDEAGGTGIGLALSRQIAGGARKGR